MKKQIVEQGLYYTIINTFEDKEYTPEEVEEIKQKAMRYIYNVLYKKERK